MPNFYCSGKINIFSVLPGVFRLVNLFLIQILPKINPFLIQKNLRPEHSMCENKS